MWKRRLPVNFQSSHHHYNLRDGDDDARRLVDDKFNHYEDEDDLADVGTVHNFDHEVLPAFSPIIVPGPSTRARWQRLSRRELRARALEPSTGPISSNESQQISVPEASGHSIVTYGLSL